MTTSPKTATTSRSLRDGSEVDLDYAFGTIRNDVFDSVLKLFKRRRDEQKLTLEELGQRMGGRKKSWVSRELSGPGNWTLRTWSDFIEALDGKVTEIKVEALEDIRKGNYDIYKDKIQLMTNSNGQQSNTATTWSGHQAGKMIEFNKFSSNS